MVQDSLEEGEMADSKEEGKMADSMEEEKVVHTLEDCMVNKMVEHEDAPAVTAETGKQKKSPKWLPVAQPLRSSSSPWQSIYNTIICNGRLFTN